MRIKTFKLFEKGSDETEVIVNDWKLAKVFDTLDKHYVGTKPDKFDHRYIVYFNPPWAGDNPEPKGFYTKKMAQDYLKNYWETNGRPTISVL